MRVSCGPLVPAVPSCILDPLREQFLALLPPHVDEHPLGCHRPRIDDAVVFDKLIEAPVFGAGYERIADAACPTTTMRRRRDEWIRLGIFDALRLAALDAYDKMIGLDLADVAVDGCTTKALRRGVRWSQPGGPGQGRNEAVPAVRWRRGADGHGVRAGQHRRSPATG